MSTFTCESSLLDDFESLLTATSGEKGFRCHASNASNANNANKANDSQCGRRINAANAELKNLCPDIINLLRSGNGDIEQLFLKAAPLVMCTQNHRGQADTQVQNWMEKIIFSRDELPQNDDEDKVNFRSLTLNMLISCQQILPSTSASLSREADPSVSSSDRYVSKAIVKATLQAGLHVSALSTVSKSHGDDFDDSGYLAIEGEERRVSAPEQSPQLVAASLLLPHTPRRTPTLEVLHDSGYHTLERSSEDKVEEPPSPSLRRSERIKQLRAKGDLARSDESLVGEPRPLKEVLKPEYIQFRPAPRKWRHYRHPAKELLHYIKQPLGKTALEEGNIYTFQLENNTNYYKIGYTNKGVNDEAIEAAVPRRMKEHKKCGWPNPKVVFRLRVLHAQRVEHIIGKHLAWCNMEEYGMTQGVNGKTCSHSTHHEWFKVSLDVIKKVARAWARWIDDKPYVKTKDGYTLSDKWGEKLETVLTIDPAGGDYWMKWLDQQGLLDGGLNEEQVKTEASVSEILDHEGNTISAVITTAKEVSLVKRDGSVQVKREASAIELNHRRGNKISAILTTAKEVSDDEYDGGILPSPNGRSAEKQVKSEVTVSARELPQGDEVTSIITTTEKVPSVDHDGEPPSAPEKPMKRRDTLRDRMRLPRAKTWNGTLNRTWNTLVSVVPGIKKRSPCR